MNNSRLRELVELILEREREFGVQGILNDASSYLSNLAANPQQPQYQTQFASALEKLQTATAQMVGSFQPAEAKLLEEIGAAQYFVTDLTSTIREWVLANPITPAVPQQQLAELVRDRSGYLATLEQLVSNLDRLNVRVVKPPEGSAEIGVLIPRDLFKNRLDQLVKELHAINRIVRAFSEVATGHVTPVEVHEISTTDPLFFLGIDPITAATIAGVVSWALNVWKQVEEIRRIRSETKKNGSFSEDEVKSFFDSKITTTINKAIDEKLTELLPHPKKAGRANEQRTDLQWALESLFARIERGMTVELRFLPPAAKPESDDPAQEQKAAAFTKLSEVAPQLVFPAPDKSPVLELPPAPPERQEPEPAEHGRSVKAPNMPVRELDL